MRRITVATVILAVSCLDGIVLAKVYDVRDYGAVADGKTVDSPAINKAIDAAAAAGGGTVHLPAGQYLSFSIRLKSNITLHLDQGATLIAATPGDLGGYDDPEPNPWGDKHQYQDFGHSHWRNSLIWGENLENIAIIGPGRIWGRGLSRDRHDAGSGNKCVALKLCKNVIIRDVSFLTGGHFCILPTGVDNFTIDNVKIDTNRDGINVDCCKNVRISNCSVNSPNDDAIVLKSSFALGYARSTENVTITNCQVTGYDIGTLFDGTYQKTQERAPDRGRVTGRIKFGTESNGGFKNISISNCVFDHCRGFALETVDGGLLEDVTISNIAMRDITNAPFFLRLGRRMRGPDGVPVGTLRRVTISDVIVNGANPTYASLIMGIPGYDVEDIQFNNVHIRIKGGAPAEHADGQVPELEDGYPDPRYFVRSGPIPSHGFFIRHVRGIELNNVDIRYEETDHRPAFVMDDVKDVEFNNVSAQKTKGVPTVVFKNVAGFQSHQCDPLPDTRCDKVSQGSM
jgi:polygalacturonase